MNNTAVEPCMSRIDYGTSTEPGFYIVGDELNFFNSYFVPSLFVLDLFTHFKLSSFHTPPPSSSPVTKLVI